MNSARGASAVPDSELAMTIQDLDALCQQQSDHIVALSSAIASLTTDETIKNLALQARAWAQDLGNDVNAFAEELGRNYKAATQGDVRR